MAPHDHTVPQLYLRRFAERHKGTGKGKEYFITACEVDDLSMRRETNVRNVATVNRFYSSFAKDGTEHRELEAFLSRVESLATPVFTALLDDGPYAFALQWPLSEDFRIRFSWYIAAQMLRTTRQRKRLVNTSAGTLQMPGSLRASDIANEHVRFIVNEISALAFIVFSRPWGLGFSGACLITSDVPVVILTGHDSEDQKLAATFWDMMVPLDPHRFLFLPGLDMVEEDSQKSVDHRLNMDGGMGVFLNQVIYDAADSYVFMHPKHEPHMMPEDRGRLPAPGTPQNSAAGPDYVLSYDVFPADLTIERRWVNEHPPNKTRKET